jgi:hypothetical protein
MIHFNWLNLQPIGDRAIYQKASGLAFALLLPVIDGLSFLIVSCFKMERNGLITIPFVACIYFVFCTVCYPDMASGRRSTFSLAMG